MNDYTKARPIEPGCLVMVVDWGVWTGDILTAIKAVCIDGVKNWYLDIPLIQINGEPPPSKAWVLPEINLIRIDDPDTQKQIEAEMKKPQRTRASASEREFYALEIHAPDAFAGD